MGVLQINDAETIDADRALIERIARTMPFQCSEADMFCVGRARRRALREVLRMRERDAAARGRSQQPMAL